MDSLNKRNNGLIAAEMILQHFMHEISIIGVWRVSIRFIIILDKVLKVDFVDLQKPKVFVDIMEFLDVIIMITILGNGINGIFVQG